MRINKRNKFCLKKSSTNHPNNSYSVLNRSVPINERYLVESTKSDYITSLASVRAKNSKNIRKIINISNVTPNPSVPDQDSSMLAKEHLHSGYYKRRIFDNDLLKNSVQVIKDQKSDMKYFRNKFEIQHYFKTEQDPEKRKKKYNEMLIFYYLQDQKSYLLHRNLVKEVIKLQKSTKTQDQYKNVRQNFKIDDDYLYKVRQRMKDRMTNIQ